MELDILKNVFRTLADSNRLKIIQSVGEKECSVGEIVKHTLLSQPLVSHHLRVLKENGVLSTKRKGPFIYYFIKNMKILYAIHLFAEIFWDSEKSGVRGSSFCPDWVIKKFNQ